MAQWLMNISFKQAFGGKIQECVSVFFTLEVRDRTYYGAQSQAITAKQSSKIKVTHIRGRHIMLNSDS